MGVVNPGTIAERILYSRWQGQRLERQRRDRGRNGRGAAAQPGTGAAADRCDTIGLVPIQSSGKRRSSLGNTAVGPGAAHSDVSQRRSTFQRRSPMAQGTCPPDHIASPQGISRSPSIRLRAHAPARYRGRRRPAKRRRGQQSAAHRTSRLPWRRRPAGAVPSRRCRHSLHRAPRILAQTITSRVRISLVTRSHWTTSGRSPNLQNPSHAAGSRRL
jgi:hypothetical protein